MKLLLCRSLPGEAAPARSNLSHGIRASIFVRRDRRTYAPDCAGKDSQYEFQAIV
jgi:hypothetical protein